MLKVAQCWDDGRATDIQLAEILRKYHAKATFNLCPGRIPRKTVRQGSWAPAGYQGWTCRGFIPGSYVGLDMLHEVYDDFSVACHGWNHEIAGTIPDDEYSRLTVDAKHFLEDTFGKKVRGLAWPCNASTPGVEQELAEAGFEYGRSTEYLDDLRENRNPMRFATSVHFQDHRFWTRYEDAKKGSGCFYFWGHTHETLDIPELWNQLEEKIRFISEDPEAEWVEAADLVSEIKKNTNY